MSTNNEFKKYADAISGKIQEQPANRKVQNSSLSGAIVSSAGEVAKAHSTLTAMCRAASGGFRREEIIVHGSHDRLEYHRMHTGWPTAMERGHYRAEHMRRPYLSDTKWPNSITIFDFLIERPQKPILPPFYLVELVAHVKHARTPVKIPAYFLYEQLMLSHTRYPINITKPPVDPSLSPSSHMFDNVA